MVPASSADALTSIRSLKRSGGVQLESTTTHRRDGRFARGRPIDCACRFGSRWSRLDRFAVAPSPADKQPATWLGRDEGPRKGVPHPPNPLQHHTNGPADGACAI